jgi:hypothetical protein
MKFSRSLLTLFVTSCIHAQAPATSTIAAPPAQKAVPSMGSPKIGVVLFESFKGKRSPIRIAEPTLIDALIERGFKVVQLPAGDSLKSARAAQGGLESASVIGAGMGADILLAGHSSMTDDDVSSNAYFQGTSMQRSTANITLQAIDVDARTLLVSKTKFGVFVAQSSAIARQSAARNTIRKMVQQDSLIDKMLTAWQQRVGNATVIAIQIRGLRDYKSSLAATQAIQANSLGIANRIYEAGRLTFDATWKGTVDDFCNFLDTRKFNEDQNTFSVVSSEKNSVLLEVK